MKSVVHKLSELGLSAYEAKVYLALLKHYPAGAYEIGRTSGVPTSKIYEVLHKLVEKGILLFLDEQGKTKRYIPINPEEFLNQTQSNLETLVTSLKEDLADINGQQELSYIWNITEYAHLIDKARRMIEGTQKVILLSLWREELALLEEKLRQAESRGIQIAVVHFGQPTIQVGQVYYHPIEDTLYAEKGGRGLVIVADSQEVLMGNIRYEGAIEGAWSQNRGFAMIAEDYVKHDIYITKIIKRFEKELIETFGENYSLLRDVLQDREIKELAAPRISKL